MEGADEHRPRGLLFSSTQEVVLDTLDVHQVSRKES